MKKELSLPVKKHIYNLKRHNAWAWNTQRTDEKDGDLVEIAGKTKKRLDRLIVSFTPFFEQTLEIPRDTTAFHANEQYYSVYNMSVSKIVVDGYKAIICHIKRPAFEKKFKEVSSAEDYQLLLKCHYRLLDNWQTRLVKERFDHLIRFGFDALLKLVCDEQGSVKLKSLALEKTIKDYCKQNCPEKYWTIALQIGLTQKNIKRIA